MKKLSLITLLILICYLPGYSQFWIEFNWNAPGCQSCAWMTQSLRMSPKQSKDYHKVIHQYGKKIEKETRKDYKHWDKAAVRIYDLRIDRDRKIQRILSPQQFNLYVRYTRERPQRIHDYRGWYENPRYKGRRISPEWHRYENNYWSHWEYRNNHQNNYQPPRPAPNNNKGQAGSGRNNNSNKNNNKGNNSNNNNKKNNR